MNIEETGLCVCEGCVCLNVKQMVVCDENEAFPNVVLLHCQWKLEKPENISVV